MWPKWLSFAIKIASACDWTPTLSRANSSSKSVRNQLWQASNFDWILTVIFSDPFDAFPTTYFIGNNGFPIDVIQGPVQDEEALIAKLEKVIEVS